MVEFRFYFFLHSYFLISQFQGQWDSSYAYARIQASGIATIESVGNMANGVPAATYHRVSSATCVFSSSVLPAHDRVTKSASAAAAVALANLALYIERGCKGLGPRRVDDAGLRNGCQARLELPNCTGATHARSSKRRQAARRNAKHQQAAGRRCWQQQAPQSSSQQH